ncbi:MAG: DUF4258 domain-containing protein [Nitrospirota bacterium]
MRYYLDVLSKLGKRIRTTKRYWEYIAEKHESIKGLEHEVKRTLEEPEYVRLSKEDKDVYLYYSRYNNYYLCVVCRHLNGDGFVITAYLTDKIKKGDGVLWNLLK